MITNLKPYPAYKDSGVPWLGKVPAHWEVQLQQYCARSARYRANIAADNIVGGPEHSMLANDVLPGRTCDFMLSNQPYGKSWKSDLERMGGKSAVGSINLDWRQVL
ncbi:MAG: hypothetical protein ACOYVI_10015 [Bacillota bacterium]